MANVKFSVITKGDWAAGFKLAGVEVHQAADAVQARQILQPMIERNEPSLVAIEEDLFPAQDRKILKHLEQKPYPVLLPLPKIKARSKEEQEQYVSELVKSCIGYYVKLK